MADEKEVVAANIKQCVHDTPKKRESPDHHRHCVLLDDADEWVYVKSLQRVEAPYRLAVEPIPQEQT